MSKSAEMQKLEEYKAGIRNGFTDLVEKTFPEKILELTTLLDSEKYSVNRADTIHTAANVQPLLPSTGGSECAGATSAPSTSGVNDLTKRFLEWNFLHMSLPPEGVMKSNAQLDQLITDVAKIQFQFRQLTAQLRTSIKLFVPKVEDGNNFGVEIQEEAVKMIQELERDLKDQWSSFSGGFNSYYSDRGSLAKDLCKEPHVQDYKEGLRQHDVKTYLFIVNVVTFIRDAYVTIHDVIMKNKEKLMIPRTSNADSLSN